jgi:hypothetical protein
MTTVYVLLQNGTDSNGNPYTYVENIIIADDAFANAQITAGVCSSWMTFDGSTLYPSPGDLYLGVEDGLYTWQNSDAVEYTTGNPVSQSS